MSVSDRLSLPYIAPQQSQKHVTHNEAVRRLDAVVQASVKDRNLAAPPPSPAAGDSYIAATGASGDWSGGADALFVFQDGAWVKIDPHTGFIVWVEDEAAALVFNGSSWQAFSGQASGGAGGGGLSTTDLASGVAELVGVNTVSDTTNRLSVKSDAVLFAPDDANSGVDCRVKIDKASASDTASLLFQSAASGRAEFGLTGDDDFHVKVSADGASWIEAILADKDNGYVGVGAMTPEARLHVQHGASGIASSQIFSGTRCVIESSGHAYVQIIGGSTNTSNLYFSDNNDGDAGAIKYSHVNNNMVFRTNGADRITLNSTGGLVVGSPSGGDKGAGTVNASALYDDNTLLSCYVFDQAIDGVIDEAKWDAKVPDRIIPAKIDATADDGERVTALERRETRQHEPLRRFAGRIGTVHDPLSLDGYARHWKSKRHLTSLPNESSFDPETGMPAGAWIQRLIETVEIQAVLIEQLNVRVKALENVRPRGPAGGATRDAQLGSTRA